MNRTSDFSAIAGRILEELNEWVTSQMEVGNVEFVLRGVNGMTAGAASRTFVGVTPEESRGETSASSCCYVARISCAQTSE